MTKEECKQRCLTLIENNFQFDKMFDKLMMSGAVGLDDMDDSYRDCYAIVASIFQNFANELSNTPCWSSDRKKVKKNMKNYMLFL